MLTRMGNYIAMLVSSMYGLTNLFLTVNSVSELKHFLNAVLQHWDKSNTHMQTFSVHILKNFKKVF